MYSETTVQRVLVKSLYDVVLRGVSEAPKNVRTARWVYKLSFVLTMYSERTSTCEGWIQDDPETDGITSTRLTHPLSRLHDPHFVIGEIGAVHRECVYGPGTTAGKGDIPTPHSKGNYFRFTNPCKRPGTRSTILRVHRISQIFQTEISEPEVSGRSPQDRQGSSGSNLRPHLCNDINFGGKLAVVGHGLWLLRVPYCPIESTMQTTVGSGE